jgi:hypothetical protein
LPKHARLTAGALCNVWWNSNRSGCTDAPAPEEDAEAAAAVAMVAAVPAVLPAAVCLSVCLSALPLLCR